MRTHTKQTARFRSGFTLIELSIVLVIIGLIVGGVLVGQDLIKAAEVRATVGQQEKYNAAVNTFRTKFNGIPGDLLYTQASAFGLYSMTSGTVGAGDGNGLLQDTDWTPSTVGAAQAGEPLLFWRQLSDASLVDGSFGQGSAINRIGGEEISSTDAALFPAAKIGRGNYWTVGSDSGFNYYLLAAHTALISTSDATYGPALTPIESYNIDVKIDDGLPNTGIVQARGTITHQTLFGSLATGNGAPTATTSTSQKCTVGPSITDTTDTYNRNAASGGNDPFCLLRLRFN
jgi:prepilin-type N-terminal cleavage/methylation domain-containing protein